MGKWKDIYQKLLNDNIDIAEQLAGTAWIDKFVPYLNRVSGNMLDLGCGLGADMLRCAKLGFQPYGLDLEPQALKFLASQYGFDVCQFNFSQPLPFENESFSFVLSRFALHYLPPDEAQEMFSEVRRILKPNGLLLFVVNSQTHRQRKLQYDYSEAIEIEPHVWYLPHDKQRTFLFYNTSLARRLVGEGWQWHYLQEEEFTHWGEINKWAVIGLAENISSI